MSQFEVDLDKIKSYTTIYPAYLDRDRSISMGRRVPASKAVHNPNIDEIAQVLKSLNMEFAVVRSKQYPKGSYIDNPMIGLVKVDLTELENKNPGRNAKRIILNMLGESIPNLKCRVNSTTSKPSTTSTDSLVQKKNKKRRR